MLALVMAGGMALSGALYADLGDRAYAAMALAAALGGVLVLLARSRVTQVIRHAARSNSTEGLSKPLP